MSKQNIYIISIIGVILIAGIIIVLTLLDTDSNIVSNSNYNSVKTVGGNTNKNKNVVISQDIVLGNNYYLARIPNGWNLSERMEGEINTVKYGAPADIITLQPTDMENEYFFPTITLQTFTIDERLSVKEVTNLIQDRKITEKIDNGNEPCLFEPDNFSFTDFDVYEFIEDTSGRYICNFDITEPGIGHTFVIKSLGSSETLLATMWVADNKEYDMYINDFKKIADSILYSLN